MFWSKPTRSSKRSDLEDRMARENEKYEKSQPKEVEKPKVIKEKVVSNNGHKKDADVKLSNNGNGHNNGNNDIEYAEEEPQMPSQGKKYEIQEEEDKPDIPGKGFLYHAKEEHLGEASRLNEREVMLLSVGDTKQSLLKSGRKNSVYETMRNRLLFYKVSLDGKGREEAIELKTVEAERTADRSTQAVGRMI